MNDTPCSKRVFPLRLAGWLAACCASYLHWLRHLLERLGHDFTLAVWQDVYQDYDDELLLRILTTGWNEVAQDESADVEETIGELLPRVFPLPIEGVSPEKARQLVEKMPLISQVKQTFPSLNVWRESTAYEALHLRLDGLARLAEALLRFHGKQGELIAYDVLREERVSAGGGRTGSVADFIADFTSEPEEANLFTAGLEMERVHAFCESNGFDIVRPRSARPAEPVHRSDTSLERPGPDYPYDVEPTTDARPYFHRFFRWSRIGTLVR